MSSTRSFSTVLLALAQLTVAFEADAQTGKPSNSGEARQPALDLPPAETPAPRSKPQIVLPKLLEPAVAPYPQHAHGDGVVVLTLTLDDKGTVVRVDVDEGVEPFRSAATDAALRFRFSPAVRQNQPISSKIRFELRFTEPVVETAPDSAPASTAPATSAEPKAGTPPPSQALEVDVLGARTEPTVRSFSRAEVRELPGAFGDPFRAIEAMPGVTPIFSGVPFFYVRGAPPGNVGYFLDGIGVPLLYHAGLGPSVIHPGLVDSVNLYPGAYPARYGRFAGGIVAGETKAPESNWRGEGNVRLFDAGALAEGPFANGKGSLLAAGRYSYTATLISLFAPNTRLEYWDYQARASYALNSRRRITLFSFGSFDYFGQTGTGSDEFLSTEFHRIDLRYDEKPSRQSDLRIAVTLGADRTRAGEDEARVLDEKVGIRSEYRNQLNSTSLLRAGVDTNLDHFSVVARQPVESPESPGQGQPNQAPPAEPAPAQPAPSRPLPNQPPPDGGRVDETENGDEEFQDIFPSRDDIAVGAHADVVWKAYPGVTLTPGGRIDFYSSDGAAALAFEPRVSAQYQISQRLSLTQALGIAHQPPSFVIPVPGFQFGGLRNGLQQSIQSSFGGELKLPDEQLLSVTTFHNAFFNMTDLLSLVRAGDRLKLDLDTRITGQAYGVEFLFKRDLSRRLGGFVSYTLSRSIRYTTVGKLASSFDRTHVFNAALGYDLGRKWRSGGRFNFYTGAPGSDDFTLSAPRRLPAYYRLDVRLEKRWQLARPGSTVSFVFEVLNTTLNREAVSQECQPLTGCKIEYIGPVTIPSIGVEATF